MSVTRERILDVAERLFAEHGVGAVSNRQIAEAAGQGNTAAVGYHFGGRTDLMRAVAERHETAIEAERVRMLEDVEGSTALRDWVDAMVRPQARHLAALGVPSWFARFAAQVTTDPMLRNVMSDVVMSSPTLHRILAGLDGCLPALPPEVRPERGAIVRILLVHVFAERERALAEGRGTPRADWDDAADGLVDAIVGVWCAPISSPDAAGPAEERRARSGSAHDRHATP